MKPLLLAAVAVPAVVGSVHAGHHATAQGMMAHVHGMLVQKLDLNKDQQEAIHRVVAAHHPALHEKALAAFQARADLLQALADTQTSVDQIRALEAKASSVDLLLELEINQVMREINPILTDAQRTKLKQLASDLRAHVEAFHGHGHGQADKAKP
jgi:Spy/CpxP family protein refolding chaperone